MIWFKTEAVLRGNGQTEDIMRNRSFVLAVCLLLGIAALAESASGDVKVGERAPPGSVNAGAIIPDSEIDGVKLAALKGSGEAARKLANHYLFGIYEPTMAAYWAQIGAENRDPVSEFNYGNLLQQNSDPDAQIRAAYWHDRAKKDGVDVLAAPDKNSKPQNK